MTRTDSQTYKGISDFFSFSSRFYLCEFTLLHSRLRLDSPATWEKFFLLSGDLIRYQTRCYTEFMDTVLNKKCLTFAFTRNLFKLFICVHIFLVSEVLHAFIVNRGKDSCWLPRREECINTSMNGGTLSDITASITPRRDPQPSLDHFTTCTQTGCHTLTRAASSQFI